MSAVDDAPEVRLVGLRETPLDVAEVVAALDDDASGGLTLFVGRVRDQDDGRGVTALEYSAHPSALGKLREVCARVAAAHDVHGIAAVHRTGRLEIGEASVGIAVSARHRAEAFDAARDVIDTLKRTVPIWKREHFEDGAVWVGEGA